MRAPRPDLEPLSRPRLPAGPRPATPGARGCCGRPSATPPTCRSTATCCDEFAGVLAAADWDVALLQECPPRWADAARARPAGPRPTACSPRATRSPRCAPLLARLNPDLIASNEGGSNLTLVRGEMRRAPRARAHARAAARAASDGVHAARPAALGARGSAIANLHASAGAARRGTAEARGARARRRARVRVGRRGRRSSSAATSTCARATRDVFERLAERHRAARARPAPTRSTTCSSRGLEIVEPPTAWPPERREVARATARAIRLSDHAPVRGDLLASCPARLQRARREVR